MVRKSMPSGYDPMGGWPRAIEAVDEFPAPLMTSADSSVGAEALCLVVC
jgi:hypothetical protein